MLTSVICTGCPTYLGNALCLTLKELKTFIIFANILLINRGCFFEIKGVFIRNNELVLQNVHESPKIKHLPFSDIRNQTQPNKRKQKSLTEPDLEEKEKLLIARCEYEKRRNANESE